MNCQLLLFSRNMFIAITVRLTRRRCNELVRRVASLHAGNSNGILKIKNNNRQVNVTSGQPE